MDNDALIHLRVPAGLKARWVRESRTAGMRLTDWIIKRMETPMLKAIPISIPADLDFSALRLARDADGAVSFDTSAIAKIEQASGLADGYFMAQPEDAVSSLIVAWYSHHRRAGGDADPAAVVGHINEDGYTYPVATIDCDQYYVAQDSIKLARFYAAANPETVLRLIAMIESPNA